MIHKVGERISARRKERNMSQEELAAVLNVSRQTISKWETSDTLPDMYNAVALAKLFHLSLDTLILGGDSRSGGSSYMSQLKEQRHKVNLTAIIVGSFGSILFITATVILRSIEIPKTTAAIIMACVFAIMMPCWGFGIWGFIKTSRISHEISYLEKLELTNLLVKNDSKG